MTVSQLIREYESLVILCDADIKSDSTSGSLELYIKGKKAAYERIIEDLKKLGSV